eukprot:SAG31_NODE_5881_length_2277_cov_1.500918_2_plen_111_part_00
MCPRACSRLPHQKALVRSREMLSTIDSPLDNHSGSASNHVDGRKKLAQAPCRAVSHAVRRGTFALRTSQRLAIVRLPGGAKTMDPKLVSQQAATRTQYLRTCHAIMRREI